MFAKGKPNSQGPQTVGPMSHNPSKGDHSMNAARTLKTRCALMAMVVLALGALTMAGRFLTAQEGTTGPYWFDTVSQCWEHCPGLEWDNCRCYRLPPIVVKPPPKK